jgi:hypothetical protein
MGHPFPHMHCWPDSVPSTVCLAPAVQGPKRWPKPQEHVHTYVSTHPPTHTHSHTHTHKRAHEPCERPECRVAFQPWHTVTAMLLRALRENIFFLHQWRPPRRMPETTPNCGKRFNKSSRLPPTAIINKHIHYPTTPFADYPKPTFQATK